MKKLRLIALAAILVGGVSAPALADWDHIGSIDVSYRQDKNSASPDFGGPVERLQFTARSSDIVCRNITATFRNGRTMSVFSGILRQSSSRNVDLPGTSHDVRRINTNCHADSRRGGSIDISADIGRYRSNWQQSPDWSRTWSHMFHWTSNVGNSIDRNTSYTVPIGNVQFTGRDARDVASGGWAGKSVRQLILQATDGDAYCTRLVASFTDGGVTASLPIKNNYPRGKDVKVGLPGDRDRDIKSLVFTCRPLNGRSVNIHISGVK